MSAAKARALGVRGAALFGSAEHAQAATAGMRNTLSAMGANVRLFESESSSNGGLSGGDNDLGQPQQRQPSLRRSAGPTRGAGGDNDENAGGDTPLQRTRNLLLMRVVVAQMERERAADVSRGTLAALLALPLLDGEEQSEMSQDENDDESSSDHPQTRIEVHYRTRAKQLAAAIAKIFANLQYVDQHGDANDGSMAAARSRDSDDDDDDNIVDGADVNNAESSRSDVADERVELTVARRQAATVLESTVLTQQSAEAVHLAELLLDALWHAGREHADVRDEVRRELAACFAQLPTQQARTIFLESFRNHEQRMYFCDLVLVDCFTFRIVKRKLPWNEPPSLAKFARVYMYIRFESPVLSKRFISLLFVIILSASFSFTLHKFSFTLHLLIFLCLLCVFRIFKIQDKD